MEAQINLLHKIIVSIVFAITVGHPTLAVADHVPKNLSQDLDPNYIGCLFAVDDAEPEFRAALQTTCLRRTGDLCSGKNGTAPPSQVIECLDFETNRGLNFLKSAAADLPAVTEQKGFFGHGYARPRDGILNDLEMLRNAPRPQNIETAVQRMITLSSAAHTLFWLARETHTPLEAHVSESFVDH